MAIKVAEIGIAVSAGNVTSYFTLIDEITIATGSPLFAAKASKGHFEITWENNILPNCLSFAALNNGGDFPFAAIPNPMTALASPAQGQSQVEVLVVNSARQVSDYTGIIYVRILCDL